MPTVEQRLEWAERKLAVLADCLAKSLEELALVDAEIGKVLEKTSPTPATATASTSTATERWNPQRDGGECIRADRLLGGLKGKFVEPNQRLDLGNYHYRSWLSRDGALMISRYPHKRA